MIINHCYQDVEMKILYDPLGEFQAKRVIDCWHTGILVPSPFPWSTTPISLCIACQDAECFTRSQDTSSIAGHFCLSTSDCKVLPWLGGDVETKNFSVLKFWGGQHHSLRWIRFLSCQAPISSSTGRTWQNVRIFYAGGILGTQTAHHRYLDKVVWKWLVYMTTWRGMYTICYCEQECLGSGWGVDTATKCYASWCFRASHHDLGIPSSGCFVNGNRYEVLPSCSVEFTSMAVGGGAIATSHLASFSGASLRFVPLVRKGRMWS